MKVVGLVSGGKDSCYNLIECIREGHEIVALGNLKPAEKDELDSYMYQTVGHDVIHLYADAIGLPLYRRTISGTSICQELNYKYNQKDEVEDLVLLLKEIQEDISFEAVAVGAILSDYQRVRVENVCLRLGIQCLSYLWRRDQDELLQDMIDSHMHAILIKVAALGLNPRKHLLSTIEDMQSPLRQLNAKYGLNICGEGGEYETMTLDCPIFIKKIVIDESEVVIHSDDAFAPVGYAKFKSMHLEDKGINHKLPLKERLDLFQYPERLIRKSCSIKDQLGDETSAVGLKKQNEANILFQIKGIEFPSVTKRKRNICVEGLFAECKEGQTVQSSTRNAFQNLADLLSNHGCTMADCVRVHLFLRDMKLFTSINEVYKEFFLINPPARVCVEVPLEKEYLFCLQCYAVNSSTEDGNCLQIQRKILHVQSISHWAPANIGPYSQAVKVGPSIFVSGSIGLDPGSMTFVQGGVKEQGVLSLRHVLRVLKAIEPSSGLEDAINVTCFVASPAHKSQVNELFYKYPIDHSVIIHQTIEVSRMPRDALVEWSVVAHTCQNKRIHVHQSEKLSNGLTIASKICQCVCNHGGFLSVTVSAKQNLDEVDWKQVMSDTAEEAHRILLHNETGMNGLLGLQIFCNIDLANRIDLFLDPLKKSFPSGFPATTVIGTEDRTSPLVIIGQIT